MLFTLAQAATTVVITVTETVTVTPPNVPVEIVKQPPSGWEAKDVAGLLIAGLSLLVSGVAFWFSLKSWKMQGPVLKIRFQEFDPQYGVWLSMSNVGRETGLLESVIVSYTKGYDWCRLPVKDFSFAGEPNHCKMLVPGEYISGQVPIREFAIAMEDSNLPLKSVGIRVRFAGQELNIKLPRKERRAIEPYVEEERKRVRDARIKRNLGGG